MSDSSRAHDPDDPLVRAAYEALLGDYFDETAMQQAQVNAVAQTVAPTRDAAVQLLFRAFQEQASAAPHSWEPTFITDRGSALIGNDLWRAEGGAAIFPKLGQFVFDLGASFAVLAYANSTSRKLEAFSVYGTDGATTRRLVAGVEYRRRSPRIWISEDGESEADSGDFLGPVVVALRENASRSNELAPSTPPENLKDDAQARSPRDSDRSFDALRERYARGEIDRDEFLQIKGDLDIE